VGDSAGNRDSFLLVRLPVAEADPVARVRAVSRATGLRKNRHDARAVYALRGSLSRVPAGVRRRLQEIVQGPREYSLNISNVPGPRGPIQVLDRRVEGLYPFAEVAPRHGLRLAAASLEGSLFIGLLADPNVVPDLDRLAASIPAEVDELRTRLGG
jgi:diacylglycerol O-acyltransferase